MGIADLGCSSGPNALPVISEIIDAIHAKCGSLGRSLPELRLFLNDLFNNDFNDIFMSLPGFYNRMREEKSTGFGLCFISGVPGSFYGRLFPRNIMPFVHSSSSLHWLSQRVRPESTMNVAQVFHVNKVADETSYAKNSTLQSKVISIAKPTVEEAILKYLETSIPESMGIADLGCSTGPNALLVISEIIDAIHAKCRSLGCSPPELRLFLNDLFNNDFNDIFGSLPGFYNRMREEKGAGFGPCFISGVPGSFYGRLFPRNSMHFVHSSSSLHWLSQVPPGLESNARAVLNKGKIYMSKSSPQCVLDAYSNQFQKDFSLFLRSRSEEIVPGGRMVLSFVGRSSSEPTTENSCYHWELLALALMSIVSEGLFKEEMVDNFNLPYYAPSLEELKLEVEKEGSFIVERLEAFSIDWDGCSIEEYRADDTLEPLSRVRGRKVAKIIRAVVASMLASHFGKDIMDHLFRRYQDMVSDYLAKSSTKYTNFVVSLIKSG